MKTANVQCEYRTYKKMFSVFFSVNTGLIKKVQCEYRTYKKSIDIKTPPKQ
jgi:hypothetical protein